MKKIYFLTFLLFPFYLWAVDDSISSYMNLEEVVVSAIRVSEKTPISHSNIEQKERTQREALVSKETESIRTCPLVRLQKSNL